MLEGVASRSLADHVELDADFIFDLHRAPGDRNWGDAKVLLLDLSLALVVAVYLLHFERYWMSFAVEVEVSSHVPAISDLFYVGGMEADFGEFFAVQYLGALHIFLDFVALVVGDIFINHFKFSRIYLKFDRRWVLGERASVDRRVDFVVVGEGGEKTCLKDADCQDGFLCVDCCCKSNATKYQQHGNNGRLFENLHAFAQ